MRPRPWRPSSPRLPAAGFGPVEGCCVSQDFAGLKMRVRDPDDTVPYGLQNRRWRWLPVVPRLPATREDSVRPGYLPGGQRPSPFLGKGCLQPKAGSAGLRHAPQGVFSGYPRSESPAQRGGKQDEVAKAENSRKSCSPGFTQG